MPLAKLSFSAYIISRKRSANQPKKLQNEVFPVKTSQVSLILQKMKIGQKSDIRPFCRKAFNYNNNKTTTTTTIMIINNNNNNSNSNSNNSNNNSNNNRNNSAC